MNKKVDATYQKLLKAKNRESILLRHFQTFLPEAIFRTTKIEHPEVTRKQVFEYLK